MGFDYTSLATNRFEMPKGWCVVLVQDVATVNEESIKPNYRHRRIEYIDIASVEKGTVKSIQELPLDDAPSRAKRIVRDNDALIATVRPNLEHYVYIKKAKQNTIASTGFAVVTAKKVNPRFLYYYLTTKPFTSYLTQIADSHTSAYPAFNPDIIETAQLLLPPPSEQLAIAIILGALDDKIELNRRMNQPLEAMAQALFKSWFIDFEPFRDQGMEESPLGPIPRGWEIKVLDDLTNFVLGGDWGKDDLQEDATEPAYCIRGTDIPDLQHAGVGKMPIRYLKPSSLGKRSLCVGDIAIEISGGSPTQSTGRTVLVTSQLLDRLDHSLVCSNFCRLIRLRPDISPNFVYYWLRRLYETDVLLKYETGTTSIKNFAYTIFSNTHHLVLPPVEVLNAFDKQVQALLRKHAYNGIESESLANIRDTLMPKLLSGEIRVKDAEKFVEEKL